MLRVGNMQDGTNTINNSSIDWVFIEKNHFTQVVFSANLLANVLNES